MNERNRVQDRAEIIYSFLKTNMGDRYGTDDLLLAVGLVDGATTRAAIKRARALAAADGLCMPIPCHANDNTHCVTNDPLDALDPALQLERVEYGVEIAKRPHHDFMRSRIRKLPKGDRTVVEAILASQSGIRAAMDGQAALTKALMDMRREQRDKDSTNG